MYTVTYKNTKNETVLSRFFETKRAAKNWAKWLRSCSYVLETSLYFGPAGGDLQERVSV